MSAVCLAAALLATGVHPPATQTDRQRAAENLSKIALAVHNYESAHGHLPDDIRDDAGRPLLSWRVAVLPYFNGPAFGRLFDRFERDEPWDSPANRAAARALPYPYQLDGDRIDVPTTYYQAFRGPDAAFLVGRPAGLIDMLDGTSNTLLVVEAGQPVPWAKPADLVAEPGRPLGPLPGPFAGVLHAVNADGGLFPIRRPVPEAALRRFAGRSDETAADATIEAMRAERAKHYAPEPPPTAAEREAVRRRKAEAAALLADLRDTLKAVENLSTDDRREGQLGISEKVVDELKSLLDRAERLRRSTLGGPDKPKPKPKGGA